MERFICKAKSIASTIAPSMTVLMLWATRSSLPTQAQKKCCSAPNQYVHLGLKALIYSYDIKTSNYIVHSCMTSSSSSPSSSSSSSSSSSLFRSFSSSSLIIDDLIGTDSGVHMSASDEPMGDSGHEWCGISKQRHPCRTAREYPPAIPLLARTGNLPGQIPWILKREYTNGRLILKEERVKRHEYLQAHRTNGRLVLKLVSLDDAVLFHQNYVDDIDNVVEEEEDGNNKADDDDEMVKEITEVVYQTERTHSFPILDVMPPYASENRKEIDEVLGSCLRIPDYNVSFKPVPMTEAKV